MVDPGGSDHVSNCCFMLNNLKSGSDGYLELLMLALHVWNGMAILHGGTRGRKHHTPPGKC